MKRSRGPETVGIEEMAELAATTGYYFLDDLSGTSVAERDHLYHLPLTAEGSWAAATRKILDSREGPQTAQPREPSRFQGVDIFARINTKPTLKRIGEIL